MLTSLHEEFFYSPFIFTSHQKKRARDRPSSEGSHHHRRPLTHDRHPPRPRFVKEPQRRLASIATLPTHRGRTGRRRPSSSRGGRGRRRRYSARPEMEMPPLFLRQPGTTQTRTHPSSSTTTAQQVCSGSDNNFMVINQKGVDPPPLDLLSKAGILIILFMDQEIIMCDFVIIRSTR